MLNDSIHVYGNPDKAARIAEAARLKSSKKLKQIEKQIDYAELQRIQIRYMKNAKARGKAPSNKSPLHLNLTNYKKFNSPLSMTGRSQSVQKSGLRSRRELTDREHLSNTSLSPLNRKSALMNAKSIERVNTIISQCKDFSRSYSKDTYHVNRDQAFVPLKYLLDESQRCLTYSRPISLEKAVKLRKREEKNDEDNFLVPLITERFRQDNFNLTTRVNKLRKGTRTRTRKHQNSYTLLLMEIDQRIQESRNEGSGEH
mmetsp:Transcript_28801/g.51260  ORF Transcript_28801/g.51260 Transcript_28801/m.51260 type:complete len:257 (-) Transcript_28801:1702-2472(-)|eukprot:CAMPEP_0204909702 /NCGR_PEP_ID=MMETSP1397-20131031/8372_1 /ASSEMBLY_ACC=CAM_ASM_000891 /TAXON_ID=49980 /ORGANISM="Climacostomum Climacostomum virens, Strain Stock W-24" /LENGTH=256 /DNA_ID=CAMNT_0052079613 /DNA_START=1 /DNA_END=771 /DNA_ORIENTATION=+